MAVIDIRTDDLRGAETIALLQAHRASMFEHSPPESVHALDLDALRQPEISLWSAWEGDQLLGCGALKHLNARHGEVKSMRTADAHVRQGVAARLLQHIVQVAVARGYAQLYLETGPGPAFAAALALYARHGFRECPPFADYVEDPFSVFMVLDLTDAQAMQKLLASGAAEAASKPFKLGVAQTFSPGPDGSNMSDLVIKLRKPE